MALEINAQYAKFVMFAQQQADAVHSKQIARVTGDDVTLDGRDIAAASKDKVAPLWRRESNKQANDTARELFRQAVADIFGGVNRIPQSVQDAMLLKDYNQGKPLTARRIMAVKAAVDDVLRRVEPALAQAKANAASLYASEPGVPVAPDRRNEIDALLETLVRTTAGDRVALDIAVANAVRFVRRGDATLRTTVQVQAKGEKLIAAVAELRAVAKGDRALFELGRKFLQKMAGADIPAGFIRGMVEAATGVGIGVMEGLSASSSAMDIHRAVCAFSDNIMTIVDAVAAEERFEGADEKKAVRNFAGALILRRIGKRDARNVVAAAAHKADFLKNAVTGEGPVADNVRKAYGRFGGPDGFDLPGTLKARRDAILRNMINVNVCEELKTLATKSPDQSQFALDRNRGMDVSLPGGATLSTDFAKARDELASLVTRGVKRTYEALDATEKGKVRLAMALLNQKSAVYAQTAGGLVLDPDGQTSVFFSAGQQPRIAFRIWLEDDGSLKVECSVKQDNISLLEATDAEGHTHSMEHLDPATKIESSFTLTVKPQELERLATLDFTGYDNNAVNDRLSDPDAKNPYSSLGGKLDPGFQFKTGAGKVVCSSEFRITIV